MIDQLEEVKSVSDKAKKIFELMQKTINEGNIKEETADKSVDHLWKMLNF